ncbi:hypothetical protein BDV95DRAFT_491738 [Massariosphaeria phaeospora]|uniref:Uncharacterized protein n=1 Tax=Massariosphaeria phaeospora TaxID=100035 RepID=A0A7C8M7I1_9PLEO|nr:hypothetical protein BDV95DRAFT_491738 [Massariosphaeria phaeospora]
MRSLRLSLVSLGVFGLCTASDVPELSDCAYFSGKDHDSEACQRPLDAVTTLAPGSFYVAKVACIDCPSKVDVEKRGNATRPKAQTEYDMLFNVTLSHDRKVLLLDDAPVFPAPPPHYILTSQIRPNFTRSGLADLSICLRYGQRDGCSAFVVSRIRLDYSYSCKHTDSLPEAIEQWEITFDAIGTTTGPEDTPWLFNSSSQQMLKVMVQGKTLEDPRYPGDVMEKDSPSFFGSYEDEPEPQYELEIMSVELVERSYTFPQPPPSTVWTKIRHFFGSDPAPADGHIVYLAEEWGYSGKKGTLKDMAGTFWLDWGYIIKAVLPGLIGGLIGAYLLYRLCLLVMREWELWRWNGMDAVWEQIRQERENEDEEGLLYHDEPGGSASPPPRYTDEVHANKPLPSKPLPEKPLPAVPLIDT